MEALGQNTMNTTVNCHCNRKPVAQLTEKSQTSGTSMQRKLPWLCVSFPSDIVI
jgi:hypothetical protein